MYHKSANCEGSMSDVQVANFDITIRGDAMPYTVIAAYRGRTAEGLFEQDSTLPFWQDTVATFAQSELLPGHEAIRDAGSRLFEGLMQRDIRDLWISIRADLESRVIQGLRLRLALHSPRVASLPWECLYDLDRNEVFAAKMDTHLVRIENDYRHVAPTRSLQTEAPLKILLIVPDDIDKVLDGAQEVERLQNALMVVGDSVELSLLDGRFDVIELGHRLQQEQPDIVHLVGHGQADGIWLWQRNQPALVRATALRTVLQHSSSTKLAFLNVCLAGASSQHTPFATVAPQLLQAGIPAVIAMQFAIADDVAIDFAQYLYKALMSGPNPGAIDAAMTYARSNLYAINPDSFAYGTPILWLNAPDGVIFTLDGQCAAPRSETPAHPGLASGAHPFTYTAAEEIELLRLQATEVEAWLQRLEAVDLGDSPADMRTLLLIWNRGIENLRGLFHQLHHLEAEASADTILLRYRQKIAQIRQQRAEIANLEELVRQRDQSKPS